LTKKLFTLFMIFLLSGITYADENKKISMAIMEFRANNTNEGYGKACMDMLSEKLFASERFILMEKNQMDRIARLNGFNEFNTADPLQIAKLGKKLNVDKMLVGSITYLGIYIIDVKVLNATSGEIEFNTKKKISSIEKLEGAIEDAALSVERHCLGYYRLTGSFDVTVEMHYLFPFGVFGRGLDPGPGTEGVVEFNSPFDLPFNLQFITGFYSFKPVNVLMNYFYMFPVYLTFSKKFNISRNINIIPSAGGGYVFSKISSGKSNGAEGIYWENRKLYYNPAILIRTEIDILLYDRWYLAVAPEYTVFFEEDRVGQFASLGLGLKMLF